jgi:hypothetical protein
LSALSDHLGGLVCAFAAALNERRISGSRELCVPKIRFSMDAGNGRGKLAG